ncbi:MAG: Vitamin K-dependent gamma-carboxylase [Verrucomicrobiales bacterium]|nr:Vitamin K-dependent gamma-carboxylase [Verrucomicrobiales bacterium]
MPMTSNDLVRNLPRLRGAAIRCFAPADIAPLIYFRIVFGLLMIWEIWHHWVARQVNSLWLPSEFHFEYFGFGWVHAPPGNWIHLLYASLLLSAAGIVIGFLYRICAAIFALGFTWLFLLDATQYFGLITYGGLLFDLFIVLFLLWRRTRPCAFIVAIAFHLTNNWLFDIGIFPWLAIVLTSLFFAPDWLRSFASNLAAVHRDLRPAPWILPLDNKLPDPAWYHLKDSPSANTSDQR